MPRYLPLSSPQMSQQQRSGGKHPHGGGGATSSDNDASPTTAKPPSKSGLKKIFCKIKRSNSGGQLGSDPAAAAPSPQPGGRPQVQNPAVPAEQQPQHFVRNGLRATAAGRLGTVLQNSRCYRTL